MMEGLVDERRVLSRMLELYSPTDQEDGVCAFLVELFKSHGLAAKRDAAGNFVGTVGNGPVEVVMMGHIDTVSGEIPVEERDGQLFGRGAVDAKGPMATFVSAALRLSRSGDLRNLKLSVVGAVGEEGDSKGARYAVGYFQPRYLIIGEPSGLDSIVLGYKGSLRLRYTLNRKASHTAGPEELAPEVAVRFWNRLTELATQMNEGKRIFDQISPGLRAVNTTSDGLNDRVEMDIGIRLPLGCDPDVLSEQLSGFAEGAQLHIAYGDPAVRGDKNNPLVRSFLGAMRKQGMQPRFKVKTGTSDMNVAGPVWGCPMLAYGPGDSTMDHTPHEHIDLAEYDRAIDVLVSALRNLDEVETN